MSSSVPGNQGKNPTQEQSRGRYGAPWGEINADRISRHGTLVKVYPSEIFAEVEIAVLSVGSATLDVKQTTRRQWNGDHRCEVGIFGSRSCAKFDGRLAEIVGLLKK